jgi:hypothetical protein
MTDETKRQKHHKDSSIAESPLFLGTVALVAVLVLFNMWQIAQLSALLGTGGGMRLGGGALSFGGSAKGTILAPVLLAPGEQAVLPGYKTKIKELPTISSNPEKEPTGDAVQDAINALVPVGTPQYGQQAGVSFDDPLTAQRVWGGYERSITLTSEQEARWQNLVGKFTCDYCCGSPSSPTIITHCGCAHARAWRGMAKWFIASFGDQYTDEQIFGELSRWKTLWYPGPTVQRVLQEQAASSGGTAGQAAVNLESLPGMVGGC